MKECWICRDNVADSGEHKFKASDIKRNYGKKLDAYYIQDQIISINSYKEKVLKFPNVICQDCNVNLTRSHDNAYDIFVKYIDSNFDILINQKFIDFEKVFNKNWLEQKKNLFRYFAKHAGCKIQSGEFPQKLKDLSDFILGKDVLPNLKLRFELKPMVKYIHEHYNKSHKYVHLFNGPTLYYGKSTDELLFGGWASYNWITTNWAYSTLANSFQKINFNKQWDELLIKDLNDYEESFYNFEKENLIAYVEYGSSLNSLEKRLDHFKKIMNT